MRPLTIGSCQKGRTRRSQRRQSLCRVLYFQVSLGRAPECRQCACEVTMYRQKLSLEEAQLSWSPSTVASFSCQFSGEGCSNLSLENLIANPKNHSQNSHGNTGGKHAVCMRGVDVLTVNVQETQLSCRSTMASFYFQMLFETSDARTWVWIIQTRRIALRTVPNEEKKNSFLFVGNTESKYRWWIASWMSRL